MGFGDQLEQKPTVVTVELYPPKGTSVDKVLQYAESIRGRVDGINVTDNQRAIMRMSPLAVCHLLRSRGHHPILQLTCRDRNRLALQADLLGAYALGIETLCLMTGDHPRLGDHPQARAVYDLDSVQLIRLARRLEQGEDLGGRKLEGSPRFVIGGVANPLADPLEPQLIKLRKKVKAGAQFIQTQPLFELEPLERFLEVTSDLRVRFLIGITPLKSAQMVRFMNSRILSRPIPQEVEERLGRSKDPVREGIEVAAELISRFKKYVSGFHVMPIGLEERLTELLDLAGL